MTPTQVALVQESFKLVVPIADVAADLFYNRLFEIDPSKRVMFQADMTDMKKKLVQTLVVVVTGLDRVEQLVPAVQALGRRHVGYGVVDADYDTVGAALLWTLEAGLGEAFTPDVHDAWAAAYGLLASTMKSAAAEVTLARAA